MKDIEGKSQRHYGQMARFRLEIDSMKHQIMRAMDDYNNVLEHQIDEAIQDCVGDIEREIAAAVRKELASAVNQMVRSKINDVMYNSDVPRVVEEAARKKLSEIIEDM